MRPYAIAGILSVIILCVVAGMWLVSWINAMDFTTALAVGLILIIPVICAWAYNKEHSVRHLSTSTDRSYRQFLKKLKPNKAKAVQPTFSGIEVNPEKIDEDSKRRRENKWRFFPSNIR